MCEKIKLNYASNIADEALFDCYCNELNGDFADIVVSIESDDNKFKIDLANLDEIWRFKSLRKNSLKYKDIKRIICEKAPGIYNFTITKYTRTGIIKDKILLSGNNILIWLDLKLSKVFLFFNHVIN